MNIKTLDQHLKEYHWMHNFADAKIAKKLVEQAADLVDEKDKVVSMTYAKKINLDGKPSPSWWLLVLTKKEIIFAESEINAPEETWRNSPNHLFIKDVTTISGEQSKLNPQLIRLVIAANEQQFVFESIDVDSVLHFVQKTQALLNGTLEEESLFLKTDELKDFDIIEPIRTRFKKPKKDHKIFNYFFNFSSLFSSNPALEALFLGFQTVWIICVIVHIGLIDSAKLTQANSITLGIVMLVINLLGLGVLVPMIINSWEPKTLNLSIRKLIFVGLFMLLLLVVSILVICQLPSSFIFSIVGLFASVGISSFIALDFARGIIEVKNS